MSVSKKSEIYDSKDDAYSQWNISENEFPIEGNNIEKLKFLINYAILAPSGHNTQPWIFRINDDNNTIEIYADRTRALPVVDPEDRELTISSGAALFNLQLAISYFGYNYETKLIPNVEKQDLLASINVTDIGKMPSKVNDTYINKLFQSITKRRTNRFKFEDKEIPESVISEIKSIIGKYENIWIHLAVQEDEKEQLADLIAEGDRIQLSDKRLRRELASWIHSNRSHSRDGMPGYAFGFNDIMSLMGPFVMRTFDMGKGQAAKDKQLASGSPILLLIGTDSDNVKDWINSGLTLSNILLYLKSENIWCSYLNQPIEVPELRKRLIDIIPRHGEGYPQLLLRIGYGQEVEPTPRRKIEQFLPSYAQERTI
jgi:hypothetical protein